MKITLGGLKAAEPALRKLLNADLDIATSFRLSKAVKAIESELTHFEESRQALVRKHGEPDADGNVTVRKDAMEAFFGDLSELNAVEVELAFEPVSISKLEGVKMSAVEMVLLSEFISE